MISPQTEEELAGVIAEAAASKTGLRITGGGTRLDLGNPVEAKNSVSTKKLSGIRHYQPEALTLIAGAGTELCEIQDALRSANQYLAFEPADHRRLLGHSGEPTIGGMVAVNASGPRRVMAGSCRDALIGVRFVNGNGRIIKNGGRVMKNVTGYDLARLMAGSFGTLGVLSEVAFKTLPAPRARAVLLAEGMHAPDALAMLRKALASPFDVSGAAHLETGLDGKPVTMIRIEGDEISVAYRADRLRKQLSGQVHWQIERDFERTAEGWAWVSDVAGLAKQEGAIWRLVCKPTEAATLVASARNSMEIYDVQYDWGGGLVWLCTSPEGDLRTTLGTYEGHATLIRSDVASKEKFGVFQKQAARLAQLSAGLRQKFDPSGILNPSILTGTEG